MIYGSPLHDQTPLTLECGDSLRTFGGLPDPLQMLPTILICPLCPSARIHLELVGRSVLQKELRCKAKECSREIQYDVWKRFDNMQAVQRFTYSY